MIGRVLGISADEVTIEALEGLVMSKRPEDQGLEFKRDFPGKSDAERREFATDVAAIANGGGGVLLFGIEEGADGTAQALKPFSLAGQAERLQQLVNSRIEPYLPVQMVEVPDANTGGSGFLVVGITGPSRPYGVKVNDRWAYPRRTGRTTDHMSESQIAQMYRDRFRRHADVRERFDELNELCTSPDVSALLPQIAVLGTPVESPGRLFMPDRATKMRILAIPAVDIGGDSPFGRPLPHQQRSGFRRVDISHGFDPAVREQYGWAGFHSDGSYHRVIRGTVVKSNIDEMSDVPGFYDTWMTVSVLAAAFGYGLLLQEFGLENDVILQIRLSENGLPAPLVPQDLATHPLEVTTASHTFATEIEVEARSLADPARVLEVTKPLLDDAFSAFSWEGCRLVTEEGKPDLGWWPSQWHSQLRAWADRFSIPLEA